MKPPVFQGVPGTRGFPGADGLFGPKVSCPHCDPVLVDYDGAEGKTFCLNRVVTENVDCQDQRVRKAYLETLDVMVNWV